MNWLRNTSGWVKYASHAIKTRQLSEHLTEELFIEALSIFCFAIINNRYSGKSSLSTYFSGICRNSSKDIQRKVITHNRYFIKEGLEQVSQLENKEIYDFHKYEELQEIVFSHLLTLEGVM